MNPIRHIWFDFSDTIVAFDEGLHEELVHESYSEITGKPITPELKEEFAKLFKEHGSYTKSFVALGKAPDFWSDRITSVDPKVFLKLKDPESPEIFQELRELVPISLWSNVHAKKMLPALGIDTEWFTNILGPDEVKKPKPALDGFHLLIERSGIPPEEILFVGDSLVKEIRPAKSLGIQAGLIWSESPEADYSFKNFGEILEVIKGKL